jgi:hypothetical protein
MTNAAAWFQRTHAPHLRHLTLKAARLEATLGREHPDTIAAHAELTAYVDEWEPILADLREQGLLAASAEN